MDAQIVDVIKVIVRDSRIGSKFLSPGPNRGGPCFPKDAGALLHMADGLNIDLAVIAAAVETNEHAVDWALEQLLAALRGPLNGALIAV